MQSYCIYAEAFAGPFRPLRAPEPPFTHKTPPFTQVLFLFDAFYGTISLRKPSSLCSYKTESEDPMKKRILALLLAFSMMLSLLPVSALADTGGGIDFAAYASNGSLPDLVMGNNGMPDVSQIEPDSEGVYQGAGWKYEIIDNNHSTLTLETGIYDFNNTKPTTKNGDVLKLVNCKVVVESGATITGGWFRQMLNYGTVENSLLSNNDIENCGGTMTNCLFKCSKPPVGVANCHKLTEVNNNVFDATLLNAPSGFMGWETYYFTGTPTLKVKLPSNKEITCINGEEHYNDLTGPDSGYYTFTPIAGDDIVLNRKDYVTNLVITADGIPVTTGRAPIYQDNNSSNPIIGYKGDSWTYMLDGGTNGKGTLTLLKKTTDTLPYDFSGYTAIECDTIVDAKDSAQDVQVIYGIFHGAVNLKGKENRYALAGNCIFNGTVTLEDSQTLLTWSYFGKDARLVNSGGGYTLNCIFAGDTSGYTFGSDKQGCLFASKPAGLTTYELHTEDNKEFSATLYVNDEFGYSKCPEKLTGQKMYVQDGAHLVVTRADGLEITNGTALNEADWSGWYRPSSVQSDIVLKRNYHLTVENGTLNDTTNAQGDFGSGTSITVQANAPTDTNTFFAGWKVTPADTKLMNGTADVDLTQSTITFDMPIAPEGLTLTATYAPNLVIRNGYPTASNGGKTACKGEGWEYILGNPEHGDFLFLSNAQIDFSKISDGSPVECKLFIGHGVAVQGGTFNGDVINNGGILGGTFNGAVENHGTIANGVFNGAVTNIDPGTVSDSITGTGTLNGKPITPNAYTLTVTGGGLVNGKTSAVVEAGDEVCLTVGEMQEGMSFNYWDLPTALTKALTDSSSGGFSNKVEPLTFTMPDLSGYTEDTRFTIRLDIRPAELPDDDDGPSVLGTMATVAVGGAAAGILVWQGVSLGVDSYLQLSLPDGVPVPANRIELVKLLWETAGKPDVVLPALYGDVSAEDGELQKATRWAIDNGLVKPADEGDASRFDPDRSVSKYEVARAWFKVQQMLK